MAFTVTPADDHSHLICRVSGTITDSIATEFTQELDRLSRELGIKRFLTDVRHAENALSVLENYNYAHSELAALEVQRDARSAILTAPGDTSHDFVETVVRNAGYNVRIFRDEAAALAWLLE